MITAGSIISRLFPIKIIINRKLAYIVISFALLLFSASCKQGKGKKHIPGLSDSITIINLPAPKPIKDSEFRRIKVASMQWFDSVLKPVNFNGGMLIAKNGNIIFEKYQGMGHRNLKDSISANTPTHIASVSKTFTAMAVLKLVQDGKVKLDDELSNYFPYFNYPGVTIRNLLNHRSGLPNYLYFMEDLNPDKSIAINNQDILNMLINRKKDIKNITSAGTHFSYCNTNYALLALLIEKISAVSYPQFLRQTFFIPLQMNNSFVYTSNDSSKVMLSCDWRGTLIPMNQMDLVYGDKNIYSTARDLLKWDRLLATNLMFNAETFLQAYTPYSNERPGIRNYGLGWRMNIYPNGKKLIYHNGWWHGNNASFIRLIDEDATIIVLSNKFSRNVYKAKQLAEIFNPELKLVSEEESNNLPDSNLLK